MSRDKKITRHTIGSEEPQSFLFLGVVSSEPDYRLSVMLNRHLGINLRKQSEEITVPAQAGTQTFSHFKTDDPKFVLISNRNGASVLLRKLKSIDFLVVFAEAGKDDRKDAENLAATLREIPEITAVFIFDSSDITDRNVELLAP